MSEYTPMAMGVAIGLAVFAWTVYDNHRLRKKAERKDQQPPSPAAKA